MNIGVSLLWHLSLHTCLNKTRVNGVQSGAFVGPTVWAYCSLLKGFRGGGLGFSAFRAEASGFGFPPFFEPTTHGCAPDFGVRPAWVGARFRWVCPLGLAQDFVPSGVQCRFAASRFCVFFVGFVWGR